jgi:A/G-specific adenine glycosylase
MLRVTVEALLGWFRLQARDLPWRGAGRSPYRVLVSEFMLQQTQVDRVAPRFESFVGRFPTLGDLAAAAEDDVVEEWSGLGYYRRARLLHRLARAVADAGGELPASASELEKLPGVGPYTAAAVASLASGEAAPVLDGNVMRVGARVLAMPGDPRTAAGRRRLEAWVGGFFAEAPAAEVNEALMELGATLCTPLDPACGRCPLAAACAARAEGRPQAYPPPRPRRGAVDVRWAAACAVAPDGRWLLRRIDEGPILRGLWLPPLAELEAGTDALFAARRVLPEVAADAAMLAPAVRHSITHRRIEVVPVRFEVEAAVLRSDGWRWADPSSPGAPTSSLLAKLVRSVASLARDA